MGSSESSIAAIVVEIRDLAPTIAELTQRVIAVTTEPQITSLEGRARAETLLPCDIAAEALGRCQILVTNNVIVLETLGIISLTRYVFELLVWMKTIHETPLTSLRFFILLMKDGEAHTSQHIAQLEAEAQFLDEIEKRDDEKARMDAIDYEARRHFTAYAADARVNGYGFQAYLIRGKAKVAAQADLEAKRKARLDFVNRFGQPLIDEAGGVSRWVWRDAAKAVKMEAEYEYIYRYTSRLLHATPTSFYTTSKNLEPSEVRLFLDYVYVRLLDVIDLVTALVVRAEAQLIEPKPDAAIGH